VSRAGTPVAETGRGCCPGRSPAAVAQHQLGAAQQTFAGESWLARSPALSLTHAVVAGSHSCTWDPILLLRRGALAPVGCDDSIQTDSWPAAHRTHRPLPVAGTIGPAPASST